MGPEVKVISERENYLEGFDALYKEQNIMKLKPLYQRKDYQ